MVSGKPVSFISKLYEPRYVQRPVAEWAKNQAAAPLVYQGAMEARAMNKDVAAPARAALPLNGRVAERMELVAPSSFAATADGRQSGELFAYSFAAPVRCR